MFKGLSTLRAAEKQQDAPVSEKAKALQAYLAAQYGAPGGADGEKKKKKKKKRAEAGVPGLKILDQDVSGFAAAAAPKRAAGPPGAVSDEEDEGGLLGDVGAAVIPTREPAAVERLFAAGLLTTPLPAVWMSRPARRCGN